MPYELNAADRLEVERRAAIDEAVHERRTAIDRDRASGAAKATQEAIDKHQRTEAARFALEPKAGSVEAIARDWALRQQEVYSTAGPGFRALVPKGILEVQAPPKPTPAPGIQTQVEQGPRPGSVEAIADQWRAAQQSYGGFGIRPK